MLNPRAILTSGSIGKKDKMSFVSLPATGGSIRSVMSSTEKFLGPPPLAILLFAGSPHPPPPPSRPHRRIVHFACYSMPAPNSNKMRKLSTTSLHESHYVRLKNSPILCKSIFPILLILKCSFLMK